MLFSQFFRLHKSDRQVIVALLLVAVSVFFLIWLTGREEATASPDAADSLAVDSLSSVPFRTAANDRRPVFYDGQPVAQKVERFPFDPNTADSTQLLRLGLQPWQVRNIYKYRAKGGIYRRKEDFARLYGLTVKQYRELEPYIRISPDYLPASTLFKDQPFGTDSVHYPEKIQAGEHVVLNLADTAMLRTVPGIGVHFASEIVKYGQRLGGYVSVDQLDEIDYFPAESKQYFVIEHPSPVLLNLNRLSLAELKRHPYINYYQAKAIIDYRRVHGRLESLDDLRLLRDFPQEAIDRLRPYVTY